MSTPQKYRQRQRLRRVDRIVDCLENALAKTGTKIAAIDRWRAEMPTEAEMEPKDKYTIFDRNARKYRKGIHSTFYNALSGSARPCDNGSANSSYRGSQVDTCFPACQPSRFLEGCLCTKQNTNTISQLNYDPSERETTWLCVVDTVWQ